MKSPLGLRPPGALMRAPKVAYFYYALWTDFAPPLTVMRKASAFFAQWAAKT